MSVRPSELQEMRLFADLSAGSLSRLAALARTATLPEGQVIAIEGEPSPPVVFVVSGMVRIFRSNVHGRKQILDYLGPGQAFYIPPVFASNTAAPASAEAAAATRLITVRPEDFHRACGESSDIALSVLRQLADRLRHLTELAHDLSLRSVRARLAHFLLQQEAAGDDDLGHWTHEELAAQLGTVREVVSRTLRALARDGRIRVGRQSIEIIDSAGLEDEADG